MKILHLIDALDYSAGARQLSLLAPALRSDGAQVEVCCLGSETPWATALRQAGVPVHVLGWTRWLDVGALWRLRSVLRDGSFDLIHVWRVPALRALALVAKHSLPKVLLSAFRTPPSVLAWWDRQLFARVRTLQMTGDLCLVPKRGRESFSETTPDPFSVVCVGKLERADGFRQALWAFDFVRYLFPRARLRLIGAGAQLDSLRRLASGLEGGAQVEFLGARPDADHALRGADLVWLPTLADGGRQIALEAMAQGRPVIASDVPSLRDLIRDGDTGLLIAPGNITQLVSSTKRLFEDDALRRRIGAAARDFVERQFPFAEAVARWRQLYRNLAA